VGGGAVRLTSDPTDESQPNLTRDGTRIAFRSERSGASGVYVSPALGGDARLIAPEGRAPKFLPDGRLIAYWTGGRLAIRGLGNVRRTFVADANGGPSRQVATDLASSGDPVWSPDGKWLLVHGRKSMSGPESGADWWLVPVNGTASRSTNVYETLAAAQIETTNLDLQPYPEDWSPNGVLFAATPRDEETRSVWRVGIDMHTGSVVGEPVKLTMGTTDDQSPASASTGLLVFAALRRDRLILGSPLDANAGRATGAVRVLRSDVGEVTRATASDDGNLIAFHGFIVDGASVWIRDLRNNRERQIATTRRTPLNPVISGDGRSVGYTVATTDTGGQSGMGAVFVIPAEGGVARQVCENCLLTQWLRGNHSVLAQFNPQAGLALVDIASGTRTDLLTSTDGPGASGFGRPLVSPDERWIAFGYRGRTYIAPFSGPHRIDTG
jgi:Tol biopolymer transport system component